MLLESSIRKRMSAFGHSENIQNYIIMKIKTHYFWVKTQSLHLIDTTILINRTYLFINGNDAEKSIIHVAIIHTVCCAYSVDQWLFLSNSLFPDMHMMPREVELQALGFLLKIFLCICKTLRTVELSLFAGDQCWVRLCSHKLFTIWLIQLICLAMQFNKPVVHEITSPRTSKFLTIHEHWPPWIRFHRKFYDHM